MPTITRFEEIEAWQAARTLTRRIYQLSNQGAFARDFGLRDQMRRAAISIMSNIAEGFESRTQALFIEFLGRAKASAGELRALVYIALDAEYIDASQFEQLCAETERCSGRISRFINYLNEQPNSRRVREDRIEYHVRKLEG
jgi:four helix bundle protein